MSAPVILPQPTPLPPTPAAALQLVKASIEALAARLGQVLDATVLTTSAQGLTQLKLGGETLTVKLSQPLPAGTQIQVAVQPSVTGTPVLVMQPRIAAPAPVPSPPVPVPAPLSTPSPGTPPTTMPVAMLRADAPAPSVTSAASASPVASVAAPSPSPLTVQVPGATAPQPAPIAQSAPQPTASPVSAIAPAVASVPPAAAMISSPVATANGAPAPATAQPVAPASAPPGAPPAATAPLSTASAPSPALTASPSQPAATAQVAGPSGSLSPLHAPPTGVALPSRAAPTAAARMAPGPAAATPVAPVPTTTLGVMALGTDRATPNSAAPGLPTAAAPANSPQPRTTAPLPLGSPAVTRQVPATLTKPASATLALAQPAQAAARQDSMAPLLQNLGALQGRLAELPRAVAEPAARLLAQRLPLNRGTPTGEAIRQAVLRSGVFLEPPAKAGSQAIDVRSTLLQLRSGLLSLLDGAEIAPVAPIGRRPPPPLREAQPRAIRGEAPTLADTATAREVGRTLLHQTEAALSRLKLTQLASQPQDARSAAVTSPDFMVELPMVLGHELSIAQLQVQRDGKNKSKPGERGWRLRFAVSFSVIGEVGAQISLLGGTTNVVIWADRTATAEALEQLLPELAPALAARGLDVGAIRLRRGAPEAASPDAGRLMDELR